MFFNDLFSNLMTNIRIRIAFSFYKLMRIHLMTPVGSGELLLAFLVMLINYKNILDL